MIYKSLKGLGTANALTSHGFKSTKQNFFNYE